jgi:F-type H+/Na+-transporting ATPase subunit alpha
MGDVFAQCYASLSFAPLALGEQVSSLTAVSEGLLDHVPLDRMNAFRAGLGSWLGQHCPEILALDDRTAALSEDLRQRLTIALKRLAHAVTTSTRADRP